jgi:protocatechuate 3,4-dioxygenase beta subunit
MKKFVPNPLGQVILSPVQGGKNFRLLALALFFSFSAFAHDVTAYTPSCGAGPQYTVTATVINVNASSNYRWQWKNSSGVWVCFANGANTINGNTYNVSGAVYNLTTTPGPIVFTNPNSGLQGLEIRMVISDGSGVNPCTLPAGNTWTSATNHFINISATPCAGPCTGRITSLYFNKLDGGTDLPITNGSAFTPNQLAGLYNLEVATTGTVGSVKYTITGPTASTNTENTSPYNSPATGAGAWTGANGSYSVNLKVYSGADATGSVCHDTTISFTLNNDCGCVTATNNLLTNPSFENGSTGWSVSGGTLTTGTGYVMCGASNGFLNWSSGTAKVWQDITGVPVGAQLTMKAYAGTHTPGISCSPKLSLIFLNAANGVISQADAVVTRDVDGAISFLELYTINAVVPAGTVKVRVQGAIGCNTLKLDAFCLTAVIPPACLGDRIWKDDDADGVQDAGEVGVAGVTLVLLNSSNQVVATTTTDAFGNYKFCNLVPGTYSVRVTPPANYTLSPKSQGGNTNLDSDFDIVTYTTSVITLNAGDNRTDVDGGLKFNQAITASVGDRVWFDTNANGTQDAGEPGVSNILVTLYNSSSVAVASRYTDANGNYLFTDVVPGTYTVGVSLPPAMVFTANNGAVSIASNSDINPANGRTASFTVNAGDQITYVDAGIKTQQTANGSIGDFVWNDLNKDGVQDAGEPGIAGTTVRLVNATTNTVVATTTTDINGKYIFNDVVPGNYIVEFVTPSGYTTTSKLNASPVTSGTDSDADAGTGRTASFTLGAGQRITTIDAGYWVTTPPGTAKLGDRVWHDVNQNGIQDAGEPSVSGVTVILYNSGGTAIKQATTDPNGNYLFTDLAAGNYTVGFSSLPAGFTFTTQGLGTAVTGSDANPATGRTGTITLAAGQTNLDVDAGIRSAQAGTASLGNRVWFDLNNNGLQDAGEVGVQGVTVELLDAAGNPVDKDPVTAGVQPTTTITNALGEYLFTGLGAGDYKVRFGTLPAGYAVVTKGAGADRTIDSDGNALAAGTSTTDVVSLSANEERLDIDLGIFSAAAPLGQLGDRVWFDANNNGIQDNGEQGVPGVSVALLDAGGATIRTTVTDANGLYKFINLADGTYSVQFSNLPAGFSFSPKDQGANDAADSDADQTSGNTGTYTIAGGSSNMTVDAGIYSVRAALGDYVWFDADSDGTQDATESGIAGVTVILYDAAGAAVASAITDQSGRYFFSNLNPGSYTVGFSTTPGKLVFTLKDVVAAGDASDSDVDPATGKTGTYTLVAGQVNLTVDAGLKPVIPASIGDFVWFDLDRNGLQDAGEPGVPGVVVTLYNSANQPIGSAVTDGNGFYLISNVPPGTGYYVKFSNQPDVTAPWTLQNVGGAGAANNSKADATGQTGTFNVAEGQNITNIDAGIYKIINLSGNVWHDVNGMSDGFVNNTGPLQSPPAVAIPVGLRAYLVNTATGLVEQVTFINGDGTFSFPNITPNSVYSVVLSSSQGIVGNPPPAAALPSGWINTGQKNANPPNSPAGSDGINDGILIVPVGSADVINANFGIRLKGGDIVIG